MAKQTFTIIDEAGLHARPTTILVNSASKFTSDITISYEEKTVNLKSIMGVMTLGVPHNAQITIEAIGKDEEEALAAVAKTLQDENLGQ